MKDTTAYVNDEWNIRPLRDHEVDALEEVAVALSLVISPIVILHPNSNQIGFVGEAARQWDTNIDIFVGKLDSRGILFVQLNSWNDIEYDKNKYVLATARNTVTLMRILRMCLRLNDAYTQMRCYKLGCWQPYDCAECDIGYWMPHGTESTTEEQRTKAFTRETAWQRKHKDTVLRPCTPVDIDILTSLYRREGLCNNDEDFGPFRQSKTSQVRPLMF